MRAGRDTSAAWRVRATAVLAALLMALGASTPAIATEAPEESPAKAHSLVDTGAKTEDSEGSVATASLAGFRPGNIISDEVFYNVNTMSAARIDSLIRAKSSTCQTGGGTTCLKDYRAATYSFAGDKYCSGYRSGGTETAAAMIYKAAMACGINPQVLLVTLEKEQSLVTRARSSTTYARAMGFGCPDNVGGVCDPAYAGFHVQVYYAARQFQVYEKATTSSGAPYFTQYAPGGYRTVRFHPNASCGSSSIFIENQATANLYYYTPYQPNGAALAAGYGTGDNCSAYGNRNFYNLFTDWFGSTGQTEVSPVGAVESWTPVVGGIRVTGWAVDPESSAALAIRVKAGETLAGRTTANQPSTAALERFPWYGDRHGFSAVIPMPADAGTVCVVANNIGAGSHRTLGCQDVSALGGDPFGEITAMTRIATGVRITGWALDPDTAGAVQIRAKSNETLLLRANADKANSSVAASYPAYGDRHGFSVDVPLAPGSQEVCIAVNNIGTGTHRTLGCETITPTGGSPVGTVDEIVAIPSGVRVSGWALDPDTTGPVTVRVTSGATELHRMTADRHDDRVATQYAAFGGAHGFSVELPLAPGARQICLQVDNVGAGSSRNLGCQSVTPGSGDPYGYISGTRPIPGGVRISGWAIDPDTRAATTVRIKEGQTNLLRATADRERSDLGTRYPEYGSAHAFTVDVPLGAGTRQLCIMADNIGHGQARSIGCITASAATGSPTGDISGWAVANGRITVAGWSIDPDTTGPVTVRLKAGVALLGRAVANAPRADLATRFPDYGAEHAFRFDVPAPAGTHDFCVVANNIGVGNHRTIGCFTATVPRA